MRVVKVRGIVLKRKNIAERDKLITLFTREKGKIEILARGIRSIKSRRAPHLELFNEAEIILHKGRTFEVASEVKSTSKAISATSPGFSNVGYLFYVTEIVDKLLPLGVSQDRVYEAFQKYLRDLAGHSYPRAVAERKAKEFVIKLLWELGFLPRGQYPQTGVTDFVEQIAERRVKTRRILEEI